MIILNLVNASTDRVRTAIQHLQFSIPNTHALILRNGRVKHSNCCRLKKQNNNFSFIYDVTTSNSHQENMEGNLSEYNTTNINYDNIKVQIWKIKTN